jgi:hypothetical protein
MENYIVWTRDDRARDSDEAWCAECGSITRTKDSIGRKDDATSPGLYLSWHLGVWRNALSVYAFLRYAFGG